MLSCHASKQTLSKRFPTRILNAFRVVPDLTYSIPLAISTNLPMKMTANFELRRVVS
jgi:hypothetical protein